MTSSHDKGKAKANSEDGSLVSPPEYTDSDDYLIALCSYEGEGPDKLRIHPGDMVKVIERNEDNWFKVSRLKDDRVGLAPGKIFVSITEECFLNSSDDKTVPPYPKP